MIIEVVYQRRIARHYDFWRKKKWAN